MKSVTCETCNEAVCSLQDNGEWHHATWVYDGAELRFYIDGIIAEVGDISGRLLRLF